MKLGEQGTGGVGTGPSSLAWKFEWMVLSDGDAVSMGVCRECLTPRSGFEGLPGKRHGLERSSSPPGGWESAR